MENLVEIHQNKSRFWVKQLEGMDYLEPSPYAHTWNNFEEGFYMQYDEFY
ncbi:hypothetical protein LR48_Vigan06g028200 [Vigna angularis]|uniref:Uncharacterized protein n=1 Tax=Phaseolus angularis TaxID=3914 RepID=A0A0L9UQL5_PHAAN|nr:hypothetical protein LR48_Vigan06g028200 [Vigna angularis]